MVEYQCVLRDRCILLDEVQATDKLFRDRERRLPDLRWSELLEDPFKQVCHLQLVSEVRLCAALCKRLEPFLYFDASLHGMMPNSRSSLVSFGVGELTFA